MGKRESLTSLFLFIKSNNRTSSLKVKSGILSRPESGVIISVITVMGIFGVLNINFFSPASLAGILSVGAETGIVTVGVAVLLIAGEFDLSTGANLAFSELLMAILISKFSFPPLVAFILMIGCGISIGFANGFITLKGRIPSLIVTLGMLFFLTGMCLLITQGYPVTAHGGLLFDLLNGRFLGDFRVSTLWLLVFVLGATIMLTKTRLGNWIFCTGGDANVARSMGIRTDRVKIISFMISGGLAAFAGAIALGRFNTVSPSSGTQLGLEAMASAVMGGVALSGGYGSIVGAAFGAFLLGTIRLGMIMSGAPAFWYSALVGILLIAATQINALTFNRRKKKC